MLYSECHITPLATIYRSRTLPVPGQILRRVGDQVSADSKIAEAEQPMGFRLLDLEKVFRSPVPKPEKVMVKKIGSQVEKGEVIASKGVLFKTECVSPVDGQILDARRGKVLIEVTPQRVELAAFYPGKIAALIPELGATIEVTGALVQGIWGTGQQVRGRVEPAVADGTATLTADRVMAAHVGTILVGGRTLARDVIERAIQYQVRGIIVASIESTLLPAIRSCPLSFMITEGFGDYPMAPSTFELLRSYEGREACFNPATQIRGEKHRPEILIPLPAERRPPPIAYGTQLQVGTRVRVLRGAYENVQGRVVSRPSHRRRLDSGIWAKGVQVDVGSLDKVFVPFENIEIIASSS